MINKLNKKTEEIIKRVSFKILGYEDGDLLLISEIIDDINELQFILKNNKNITSIITIILSSLKKQLNNKRDPDFIQLFSDGIDLIYKILTRKNKKNKELEEEISSYIKKYKSPISKKEFTSKKVEKKDKIKSQKTKSVESSVISTDSESFKIFLAEAGEKILLAQDYILKLEKDLKNKELINNLFRIFHTIKGECGFLRLSSLGELSHNIENLLELIRSDDIEMNIDIIDLLLDGIDYANEILNEHKKGNITLFAQIEIDEYIKKINNQTKKVKTSIGELLSEEGKISEEDVDRILQKQKLLNYSKKFCEIAKDDNLITEDDIKDSLEKQKIISKSLENKLDRIDTIIKVKSSQINYLVDMIGELLIAENQLDENSKDVVQLKKISRELQVAAMQLRTVKIKNLFINMNRVVRDLSRKLNKIINLETIGDELEIDRNLVELLEEPLIHILRNAVYHGIENEKDRIKKNKDAIGKITMKAERKGNNILISVKDDGRGLDENKILEKAISRSIISKEKSKNIPKNEIYNFIFLPGFSTAEEIDEVSGRGVGMDIIKTVTNSARGKVDLKSEKDMFTEIILTFPLSMAIIDGMIVRVFEYYFIIPVSNIVESIQIEKGMIYKIKNKRSVIDLRNEVIPIVEINDFFNIEVIDNQERMVGVVIESHDNKYLLIVNEIISKKEIVIKPLSSKFNKLRGISSGTILPGGKIGFILNIDEIINISID